MRYLGGNFVSCWCAFGVFGIVRDLVYGHLISERVMGAILEVLEKGVRDLVCGCLISVCVLVLSH